MEIMGWRIEMDLMLSELEEEAGNGGASNGNGIAGGNEGDPSPVIASMIAPFLQRHPCPRSVMIAKQMATPAAGEDESVFGPVPSAPINLYWRPMLLI